jgi:transcriptional regulator with XRE-family HTH domain
VTIGDRVRAKRKALRLSQEAVARRAGLSLNQVNRLERGEITDPHYSTLSGLAKALGTPISELIGESALPLGSAPGPGAAEDLIDDSRVVEQLAEETRRPELEVELTNLWKSLAKRANTLKQRYRQGITYEGFPEDLGRLSEDHEYLERLRKGREGAPRAYHMEPDELADAIDAVLVEENAISAMIEQDLNAPEWAKQQARRFRQAV